jgi:tetratricopeptide (TPR) repeat protein
MREWRRSIASLLCAFAFTPLFGSHGAGAYSQRQLGANPSNQALTLFNQGTSLLRSNQNQEAAVKFERACALSPDFAEAHHEWAVALLKLNQGDEAIDQFNQALKLDPSLTASWLSLGAAYQTCGRASEAVATYKAFLSKFPQDDDVPRVRNLIAVLERDSTGSGNALPPKADAAVRTSPQPAPTAVAATINSGGSGYSAPVSNQGKIRWPAKRMPLRVYIANGDLIPGFRPLFAAVFREAFLRWAEAGQGLISFDFVDTQSDADIVCKWNANTLKYKNSSEPALTNLYSDSKGLAKGEIEILTISPLTNQPVTEKRMRATILHEVGHVLGLASHTGNPQDIMSNWFNFRDNPEDLSETDKDTLTHLYKSR